MVVHAGHERDLGAVGEAHGGDVGALPVFGDEQAQTQVFDAVAATIDREGDDVGGQGRDGLENPARQMRRLFQIGAVVG